VQSQWGNDLTVSGDCEADVQTKHMAPLHYHLTEVKLYQDI